jgi:hypothetical protein
LGSRRPAGTAIGDTIADLIEPFFRLHSIDRSKVTLIQMDGGASPSS